MKADFSAPLPYRARLEAGAKLTRVASGNDVAFIRTADGASMLDPNISNHFRYEENINAAYVTVRRGTPQTTLQAGLRAEQTNTLAAVTGRYAHERQYLRLFPSALVQRTLNERHGLALSLARRIDRPSYSQLNPCGPTPTPLPTVPAIPTSSSRPATTLS
ncbi:outer membrane beta-barrel protein [Hymenobacter humi]|uniref:Outer membrane beta-barrel protein n=1 Tax=Hymenobacter humi TaxID=1411620 RepID=A0ABW2U8V0_9BACT